MRGSGASSTARGRGVRAFRRDRRLRIVTGFRRIRKSIRDRNGLAGGPARVELPGKGTGRGRGVRVVAAGPSAPIVEDGAPPAEARHGGSRMTSAIVSVTLALAMSSTGGLFGEGRPGSGGWIMPPLPGNGAGFPNGSPDGYGWFDYGWYLPISADRTSGCSIQRQSRTPATQMSLPTYYTPYVSRGQRYTPYSGCGGWPPAGGPPMASAEMPMHPYNNTIG